MIEAYFRVYFHKIGEEISFKIGSTLFQIEFKSELEGTNGKL